MRDVGFTLDATDGGARATTLRLARGEVKTPVYMPVGTQGAVRSVSPLHLQSTGSQIVLANTYHLSQRPGENDQFSHFSIPIVFSTVISILTQAAGGYIPRGYKRD